MRVIYYALTTFTFLGCSIQAPQVALPKDMNLSEQRYVSSTKIQDKTKLVHIVKRADNTMVDFWVDPFEDEVLIDFTFSKPSVSTNLPVKSDEKLASSTKDTHKKKIESKIESKMDENITKNSASKKSSYTIEDYLNNYENAQALYYAKKYNKSLIAVKKAIELNPDVAQGYKLKGTILYTLNRFDEALDAWHKALKLNPTLEDVKASIKELESSVE